MARQKNLDTLVVKMYRLSTRIKELEVEYEQMKKDIIDELRKLPNQEYITTDPKSGIKIEAKLVVREIWDISPKEFIERFKERIDINEFLKVDTNKVRQASVQYGLFKIEELNEIGLKIREIEYVTVREVKRK